MHEAAKRSARLKDELDFSQIKIGNLILKAIKETRQWVSTNTNLGIVMLLTPLASAAGMITEKDLQGLRETVNRIMLQTTPQDAVNPYEAISIAQPGGMGKRDQFDVNDEKRKDLLFFCFFVILFIKRGHLLLKCVQVLIQVVHTERPF